MSDVHSGHGEHSHPSEGGPVWELVQEDIVSMTSEARMLRHEVAKQKKRVWLVVVCLIALAIPTVISIAGYQRQGAALEVLKSNSQVNKHNGKILVECTTPGPEQPTAANKFTTGHKCYDEGQARTNVAIKQIVCAIRPDLKGCEVSQ